MFQFRIDSFGGTRGESHFITSPVQTFYAATSKIAIGEAASMIYCTPKLDHFPRIRPSALPNITRSLLVTKIEGVYWTIEEGPRFIDHLCPEEALGFLASMLLHGTPTYASAFQTYEQAVDHPHWGWGYRHALPISGLLTHQEIE